MYKKRRNNEKKKSSKRNLKFTSDRLSTIGQRNISRLSINYEALNTKKYIETTQKIVGAIEEINTQNAEVVLIICKLIAKGHAEAIIILFNFFLSLTRRKKEEESNESCEQLAKPLMISAMNVKFQRRSINCKTLPFLLKVLRLLPLSRALRSFVIETDT